MNNKRSVIWLVLGCIISIMKASLMALQNRLETILKEVSEIMNRIRTAFQRQFRRIIVALSFLSAMTGPALASVTRDESYALIKTLVNPALEVLIFPIVPVITGLLILAAALTGFGGKETKAKMWEDIIWYIEAGLVVEIILGAFWAITKFVSIWGGYTPTI